MLQFSKLNRVMEADTISKNGRSSKSQTSRGNFIKKVYFYGGIIKDDNKIEVIKTN